MEHNYKSRNLKIALQILALAVLYALLLHNYTIFQRDVGWPTVLWVTCFDFVVYSISIYVAALLLLPRLFAKGRYLRFALAYALLVSFCAAALFVDDTLMLKLAGERETFADSLSYYVGAMRMVLLLSIAGMGIRGLVNWMSSTRQITEMREEALRTELALLRTQLNPHFLFNTLNHIFGHIDKSNKTARDMVLRFADLMRYQLYECDVALIDVSREVDCLQDYIELQRLRRNEHLDCQLRLQDSLTGFSIPPLLLLPVVENAFKHMSTDDGAFLHIEMNYRDHVFHFSCINRKAPIPISEPFRTNGIGLHNIRRRLELIYPHRHEFSIRDTSDTFSVQLSISI